VVVVTPGPGATNALSPLVEAHAGSQPVLLVMSDVPSGLVGRDMGALHEVPNQIECFRPVSRWADALQNGSEIPGAVQGAFHLFRTGRPGPVTLSIPTDLLTAPVEARLTPAGEGRRPPCDVGIAEVSAGAVRRARAPRGGGRAGPHAGAASAARGGRGCDRSRGDVGAGGAGAPARCAGDHVRDGARRDPGDRSAVARRAPEPTRDEGCARGRGRDP